MNQNKLKSYAPKARRDFMASVTDRAALYGLTPEGAERVVEQGDAVLIGDRPFPRDVAEKRRRLEERFIRDDDFDQTIEAMAYTWFNRFVAIRYMELHGYLDHGYRVLSHPEGGEQPELLEHAADIDLPGLDRDKVVDLKLDGAKDEELYRLLLQAQCNALHRAMPFLFDLVGDQTELLLPTNLLHTDSLIRQLVDGIDESDWAEIEIVGWLYQFYISEKKDKVIGKVVKPEDIPAATQQFTPNWIVKYLVQNSLGAQWLATDPSSQLKEQMEYYVEPAEQAEEVNAQLKAITPDTLDPEDLTLIDPACGSGHILVEAYNLFKAIYLERGYRQADVPKLILEKNLFGLDIDKRAEQLTGFALMMKGRADNRRLFDPKVGVKLNVMAFVNSTDFDAEWLAERVELADYGLQASDLTELKMLFQDATTFGSLIQVPEEVAAKLSALRRLRREHRELAQGEVFLSETLPQLRLLTLQAQLLVAQYDAVVTNPPYMGGKGMHALVKKFAKDHFPDAKADLFSCFIERSYTLARCAGHIAMVTMQSWMFLSSFEKMRKRLLRERTITTMAHLGARAFGSISGEVVQTTAFALHNRSAHGYRPLFFRLLEGNEEEKRASLGRGRNRFDGTYQHEFNGIPGSPVAYWLSRQMRRVFEIGTSLGEVADAVVGLQTGDNSKFVRYWYEVGNANVNYRATSREEASQSSAKWFPYNKGGGFRRWYGNHSFVVNWENDGREIRKFGTQNGGRPGSRAQNTQFYFLPSLSWSKITSSGFSIRRFPPGFIFDVAGCSIFGGDALLMLSCMNSTIMAQVVNSLSPTLNFEAGQVQEFPLIEPKAAKAKLLEVIDGLVSGAESDWDDYERSWNFQSLPLLMKFSEPTQTLESSYAARIAHNSASIEKMKRFEEENNALFIDAYGLQDELTPDVPIEQITLTLNPAYRYGGKVTEEEQWTRFRQDTMQELVSYAVGCMMGRYSLDEPGLIYAHGGNADFDSSRYEAFPADEDGIIPITDSQWFDDDVARRLIEFISVAWDADRLEDNLSFLADNLSPRKNDASRDTIRHYLCDSFFKDHLQTYKNRPIYWLFSSGKAKAFQCLVYLHRYNGGTLARMRTEYAVPLQGMMASRVRRLDDDIAAAASTAHRKRLEKERSTLVKQQAELQAFDEKLRHYADQRISLDLDDGVKVNYGKFGDLLAEVKKVTGRKAD